LRKQRRNVRKKKLLIKPTKMPKTKRRLIKQLIRNKKIRRRRRLSKPLLRQKKMRKRRRRKLKLLKRRKRKLKRLRRHLLPPKESVHSL